MSEEVVSFSKTNRGAKGPGLSSFTDVNDITRALPSVYFPGSALGETGSCEKKKKRGTATATRSLSRSPATAPGEKTKNQKKKKRAALIGEELKNHHFVSTGVYFITTIWKEVSSLELGTPSFPTSYSPLHLYILYIDKYSSYTYLHSNFAIYTLLLIPPSLNKRTNFMQTINISHNLYILII